MIKRIKLFYSIYNFFNPKKISHFKNLSSKHKANVSSILPITSENFEGIKINKPWLDSNENVINLSSKKDFTKFSSETQKKLMLWENDGYIVLNNFFSNDEINVINNEIERLKKEKKIQLEKKSDRAIFAYKYSKKIRAIANKKELLEILTFITGEEITLFQTLNFIFGTQQAAHSDSIHMTTYPLGYMIAAWMPLEDITEDSGPLFYYPGSHKLPYVLKKDFNHEGNYFLIGKNIYKNYEEKIADVIKLNKLKKEVFTPKKGDVLIWHANLIHGGEKRSNPNKTRKSMVMHFFCKNAFCYHEITERVALID